LFPAPKDSEKPLENVSESHARVWFVVKQDVPYPKCWYTAAEPSFVIERFELHIETDS
jgi:hypothetical protein